MKTLHINKESFNFQLINGDLRKIRLTDKEIIQRIYYAVRDEEWLNIPYSIENLKEEVSGSEYICTYNMIFRSETVHFVVKFKVVVKNNCLTIETHGKSLSEFKKNRIGLCVHLPASLKGTSCKIAHTNKNFTQSELPVLVAPHQPFKDISEIELQFEEFLSTIHFEGDIFEMEDQRNWTDASYKIYSTPLELPFPVEVKSGDVFYQKITISTSSFNNTTLKDKNIDKAIVSEYFPCPDFGIYDIQNAPDNSKQLFSHTRIDFRLYEKFWEKDISSTVEKAKNLQLPIYCMLYFTENHEEETKRFIHFIESFQLKDDIHSIALLATGKFVLQDTTLDAITTVLRNFYPTVRIGGGTDANFAQLNRNRPKTDSSDFMFYSIQPQEHASDKLSLIENIQGQYDTVATAKSFGYGKEIDISALSFYRRFNANTHFIVEKEIDVNYNYRGSNFEASWFIGAIHQLITAGVKTVTLAYDLEENTPLLKFFYYIAKHRPEYFYLEGSFSPEEYSFISWDSDDKKYSVFANLTGKRLKIVHQEVEIELEANEISYSESKLSH